MFRLHGELINMRVIHETVQSAAVSGHAHERLWHDPACWVGFAEIIKPASRTLYRPPKTPSSAAMRR